MLTENLFRIINLLQKSHFNLTSLIVKMIIHFIIVCMYKNNMFRKYKKDHSSKKFAFVSLLKNNKINRMKIQLRKR